MKAISSRLVFSTLEVRTVSIRNLSASTQTDEPVNGPVESIQALAWQVDLKHAIEALKVHP